ncbi:MAG TPA: glycosyltransferase [Blastocatellia bacterium]|nr:glycosyltransferase [Blastocatellia bacterium]
MSVRLRPLLKDEKIAVAIPTKNRHGYLTALLTSLANQTYKNWMLVVNDSSDSPVEEDNVIKDLLTLIRMQGHEVNIIRTNTGWNRHQRAMEAIPETIELIVRVDDDVMFPPDFLRQIIKPFYFFPDKPVAAVGGCAPEPNRQPLNLDFVLTNDHWTPTIDEPTWRLQGNHYHQQYVIEVESLLGHVICYRRSAVEAVGGWAVKGYSNQAHREETDLCMRLRAAHSTLLVTTEALAWHLYSPGGGSRTISKDATGVHLAKADIEKISFDELLFRKRLQELKEQGLTEQVLFKYRLQDLESSCVRPLPIVTWTDLIKRRVNQASRLIKRIAIR